MNCLKKKRRKAALNYNTVRSCYMQCLSRNLVTVWFYDKLQNLITYLMRPHCVFKSSIQTMLNKNRSINKTLSHLLHVAPLGKYNHSRRYTVRTSNQGYVFVHSVLILCIHSIILHDCIFMHRGFFNKISRYMNILADGLNRGAWTYQEDRTLWQMASKCSEQCNLHLV